ncbi:SAM-dependent methyltransferase [Kitasatospora sp. NPDC088783]|uniref:SAM-dependent methyltransferase n=1 Tax=Kitasatospora sp. NPDC088783 TaxID=3364077 RepID=UPI0038294A64
MQLTIEQIATVVGGHEKVADDYQGGTTAIIRLDARFPESMTVGLEEFSHLTVLWHFDQASPEDVHLKGLRHPRGDTRWPATGTLAHRNHRRPNQLAVSYPRLIGVDGRDLHVTDLDAVDGTPVLDIGPWFKEMGPRGPVHQPAWPSEMLGSAYWEGADKRP